MNGCSHSPDNPSEKDPRQAILNAASQCPSRSKEPGSPATEGSGVGMGQEGLTRLLGGPGGSPARLFPLLLASAVELASFIVCRSGNARLGDGFLDNSEFCDLVVSFRALQSK